MTCDYGRTYGREAAEQIDGHGQWLSIREDELLPIVEQFFAERIFGPMRLDKLARQLRAHEKTTVKQTLATHRDLRDTIADLDRRIGLQIEALETGSNRSSSASASRNSVRTRRRPRPSSAPSPPRTRPNGRGEPAALLERIPDLTQLCATPHPRSSASSSTPSACRSATTS